MPHQIDIDSSRTHGPAMLTIGSHPDADYCVYDDDTVQGCHSIIRRTDGGSIQLFDCNTDTGTYWNGKRVQHNRSTPLTSPGGTLRVGQTDIEIRIADSWLASVMSATVR